MRKYFSGNYVFPSPKSSEYQKKKGHHRDLGLHSAGVSGIYSCWRALFWLINQRWNLVGGTPNLDGGTLTLDGGKRPPRPRYNLNTVSRVLGASEQAANWMYNSNKHTETLHHLKPKPDTPNYAEAVVIKTVCIIHYLAPHAAC